MLFVQVAMAAQACMVQPASGAPASAAPSHAHHEAMPCHDTDASAPVNHCVQRCDAAQQTPGHQQPVSFAPVLIAIYPVDLLVRLPVPHSAWIESRALLTRATAPPLSVRNCCFRI